MVTKRPYFVVGPDLQWDMSLGDRAIKLVSPDWCPITIVKSQQLSFKIGYMNSSDYTYDRVPVQHVNGHHNDIAYCEITQGRVYIYMIWYIVWSGKQGPFWYKDVVLPV